jgi:hypothetical protein
MVYNDLDRKKVILIEIVLIICFNIRHFLSFLPAVRIFLVDINVPSQADHIETVNVTPVGNVYSPL